MTSHMNVYDPFERKDPTHEDNLTRAFLIVLKCVPVAHEAFLQLADAGHRLNQGLGIPGLHALPECTVETQISSVGEPVERVVSVLLTDEHYFMADDVGPSERKQVLDGLVTYAPMLALAIENKPFVGDVWKGQLSVNVPDETEHDKRVACVKWRSIVSAYSTLLQNRLLGPAETILVDDFLTFIEVHFPELQPYSNLRVCGKDAFRIKRRCRMLLEDIAPKSVRYASGWGWYIDIGTHAVAIRIALRAVPDEAVTSIVLELAPGDTLGQARDLFRDFEYEVFENLEANGWNVEPNFHLSFMQQHLVYPKTSLGTREYWSFWKTNRDSLRQLRRDEWPSYIHFLIENGIAASIDEPSFHDKFTNTQRSTLNVCPGLSLGKTIPLEVAVAKDSDHSLGAFLQKEIAHVSNCLRIPLPY